MAQQTDPRILGTEPSVTIFHPGHHRNDYYVTL